MSNENLPPEVQQRIKEMQSREFAMVCPDGHITGTSSPDTETTCTHEKESALMPGSFVKCGLPRKRAQEEHVMQRDVNVATDPPPGVQCREVQYALGLGSGKCELCEDDKKLFAQGEPIMEVPDDQPRGPRHYAHLVCFWKQRSLQWEQMFQQAHQTLCFVVASCGNRAKVSRSDIERAVACGFQLDVKPTSDNGMRLKLNTRSGIVGVKGRV